MMTKRCISRLTIQLASFGILILSCGEPKGQMGYVKNMVVTRGDGSKILAVYRYNQDSLLHGTSVFYSFPDSTVFSKVDYVEGMKHGSHYLFWPNGQIKSENTFKAGLQHGTSTEYYDTGVLKSVSEWRKDTLIGISTFYSPDGSKRLLNINDFQGKTFYVIEYGTGGQILYEDGELVSPHYVIRKGAMAALDTLILSVVSRDDISTKVKLIENESHQNLEVKGTVVSIPIHSKKAMVVVLVELVRPNGEIHSSDTMIIDLR